MEARRASPDRLRAEREAPERRRRMSLLTGAVGLGALFGGGILTIAVPGWILPLTGLMVVGVILLVVAFVLARGSAFAQIRHPDR
ncbi:MAG: hypothetical protein E6K19_09025 [Methanobacteriota archaeon]|nr:MAG: hypothetical protein E6K19_09025 [Euryarchaeota archaeon]